MSKFIKGMDLSTLLELERCGAKYYQDGKEKDCLLYTSPSPRDA